MLSNESCTRRPQPAIHREAENAGGMGISVQLPIVQTSIRTRKRSPVRVQVYVAVRGNNYSIPDVFSREPRRILTTNVTLQRNAHDEKSSLEGVVPIPMLGLSRAFFWWEAGIVAH